jgi:DNA-binding transcriptional LysR family regulator
MCTFMCKRPTAIRTSSTTTLMWRSAIAANDGQILRAAALDGIGILVQPAYIVYEDMLAGRPVLVLDEWDPPRLTINLAYPSRKHFSAKVPTIIDFMSEHFAHMDYEKKGPVASV